MPFAGDGTYSLPSGSSAVTGATILSATHNNPVQDIASALSQLLLRSGVAPMTGALNMNGKKITNVAAGSAAGDGLRYSQLFVGSNTLDLGTAAAVKAGTLDLGHATDTTLSRGAAGILAVEGVPLLNADHCAFKCTKNGDQALSTTGALTTITGWTEVYDQGSKFASNAWVPIAGRVAIDAMLTLTDDAACNAILFIMKNLTTVVAAVQITTGTGGAAARQAVHLHGEDDANGTDSYTLRYWSSSAGYTVRQDDDISGVPYLVSRFSGHMIGG